jgi:isopenicillin N synthase-like dioxygenase
MTTEIPTVDLAAPGADAALADALITSQCAFVINHGVPAELRSRMASISAAFFDLPDDAKSAVRWPGTGRWAGWQPVYAGVTELTGERVPDLIERFEMFEPDTFARWPGTAGGFDADGFRTTWVDYHRACADLSTRLMVMLADQLDLPADEMGPWTDGQYANLVVNNYPAQTTPPVEGQARTMAHTDRGGITLLSADDAPGGLEVRLHGSGHWTPVIIPTEAYLVQAGDLLARWTNRVIRANIHRVVNPPAEVAATARRQAVVYFHYPNLDAVVTPAPACVAASGEQALAPLHAGDHLMFRQASFAKTGEAVGYGEIDGLERAS